MTRLPDLPVLQLLVAVQEHGSLSAAARACGLAQPNVSRTLARLEQRLDIPLLIRSPRGSTLTEDGQLVVEWAKSLLDAATTFNESVRALSNSDPSRITVGASLTIAEYLLPHWLGRFHRGHQDAHVALSIHNSAEIFRLLLTGRLQLGFVESASLPPGLHAQRVGADELVLVVHPDHPWADRRSPVSKSELGATALVMREPGSGTRETIERFLGSGGGAQIALEVSSNAGVKIGVSAGMGPGLISRLAVEAQLRTGELLEVPMTEALVRNLHAVWAQPHTPVGAVREFIELAAASDRC